MIFIGIDGTGPRDRDQYQQERQDGFVKELFRTVIAAGGRALYLRGPNIASFGLRRMLRLKHPSQVIYLAGYAESTVLRLLREGVKEPIIFAGYSRGGAACIAAARRLRTSAPKLKIDAMALFDAVDRDPFIDTSIISGNVVKVYHAIRDKTVGSRSYFSNTGLSIEPPGAIEDKHFFGTHAALGGTPFTGDHPMRPALPAEVDPMLWALATDPMTGMPPLILVPAITAPQDHVAAQEVKQWMWERLAKHVPFKLSARG